jgi:hypothetical protein
MGETTTSRQLCGTIKTIILQHKCQNRTLAKFCRLIIRTTLCMDSNIQERTNKKWRWKKYLLSGRLNDTEMMDHKHNREVRELRIKKVKIIIQNMKNCEDISNEYLTLL